MTAASPPLSKLDPLPLLLALPPLSLASFLAARRAALFCPKAKGAGAVGCMPARAAAAPGAEESVERRRAEGARDGRDSLRGDLRAEGGGWREPVPGTVRLPPVPGIRTGRRGGAAEEREVSAAAAPAVDGADMESDGRPRPPLSDARRIALSERSGPMCEARRARKVGVGGGAPASPDDEAEAASGLAATRGATRPDEPGAIEKEASPRAALEVLPRSWKGEREV